MLNQELNQMLTHVHDIEKVAKKSYEIFEKTKDEVAVNDFEIVLEDLKKKVVRNTLSNMVNIIDRVIEDGTKNREGKNRQFNVNSVLVSPDDILYLVVREVLGVDLIDKKYILDDETTLIDFKDVLRVF